MKEALFWQVEGQKVRCLLCPHNCLISEGKVGKCKVRFNKDGKLFSQAYGNLCALALDPIEKKPLYHFLPGTKTLSIAHEGCNLQCKNCQNFNISQKLSSNIVAELWPEQLVKLALNKKIPSISFTYTEPTVFYEYVLETAKISHLYGIKNILVSNGYIMPQALQQLSAFLDAVNIDVKAFENEVYKQLTGAQLQPVLDTILYLVEQHIHVELTYLMVPGFSDNIEQIHAFLEWLLRHSLNHIPIHFSRFFPTYELEKLQPTPLEHIQNAYFEAQKMGMKYVYQGNVRLMDNATYCPRCKNILISRKDFYEVNYRGIKNGKCNSCSYNIYGVF
ncbi:MAG: AmmeMemoRadiSam system radical SAM enzyme [Bacteroidales bacterium]|nr:AmmeMemoRadiSam system radical SAM enzyme [Bacteroidales bacterium]